MVYLCEKGYKGIASTFMFGWGENRDKRKQTEQRAFSSFSTFSSFSRFSSFSESMHKKGYKGIVSTFMFGEKGENREHSLLSLLSLYL